MGAGQNYEHKANVLASSYLGLGEKLIFFFILKNDASQAGRNPVSQVKSQAIFWYRNAIAQHGIAQYIS